MERQLINKTYYETFTDGMEHVHPIQILGELYEQEQQNDSENLSHIRFAQGEIYFLNKDYEAAIFKWENISNELQPWAQKNIADAHLKMNLLAVAEENYKAVETESDVLKTEVLLHLFSIYIQLGKHEMAVHSIKSAVNLNPDYPDVTDMARAFFEEHNDFGNAIELAVNEAIRTESLSWHSILEGYADRGFTKEMEPNYVRELLTRLYRLNHARFESLTIALWNSYKQTDAYFDWLKEVNQLLLDIEIERSYIWENLSTQYKQTYLDLINGELLIKDLTRRPRWRST